jgi:hypothetical protein
MSEWLKETAFALLVAVAIVALTLLSPLKFGHDITDEYEIENLLYNNYHVSYSIELNNVEEWYDLDPNEDTYDIVYVDELKNDYGKDIPYAIEEHRFGFEWISYPQSYVIKINKSLAEGECCNEH